VPIWRYLRQTVSTNNAALVAPGGTKPTSVLSLTGIDGKVEVFAHISEAVDQYLLEDNAELGRFLTGQLQFGLARAVEAQVLNGTGTGQLLGLRNTVGIQTQASLGAGLMIQTLRAGVTKLEDLGYSADLLVVNSANWQTIEATRQSGGNFDLGGPIDRAAKKAWGVPVVSTPLIPALSALALNLGAVALDTDTRGVKTDWDVATGFAVNTTRVRLEGRFGLSVFAPLGVVAITLS
jgi:HK97 family phage major capsid protein